SFDARVYHDLYDDIQRSILLPATPPVVVVRSAAEGCIYGLDLELIAQPDDFFELALIYGYIDAGYDDWPDLDPETLTPINRKDEDFGNTPEHKITAIPKVYWNLPNNGGEASFMVQVSYQSRIAVNDINTPSSYADSYTLVNARADWK